MSPSPFVCQCDGAGSEERSGRGSPEIDHCVTTSDCVTTSHQKPLGAVKKTLGKTDLGSSLRVLWTVLRLWFSQARNGLEKGLYQN